MVALSGSSPHSDVSQGRPNSLKVTFRSDTKPRVHLVADKLTIHEKSCRDGEASLES
jgi:hypothetical protein